jgi:hypothetical protein
MKKIMCFIALFLYIMGTIGGIGYCIYSNAYVIAIAVAVLAIMAFPTAKTMFKFLTN